MFTKAGEWQYLGQAVHDVRIEPINTNVLSLEFFDRLYNNKIVRDNGGQIRKCIEEYKDEFIVSDELRKVDIQEHSSDIRISCLFRLCLWMNSRIMIYSLIMIEKNSSSSK